MTKNGYSKTMVKGAALILTLLLAGAARGGEVPLRIDVPTNITSGTWPVTVGVPFPDQTLTPGMSVVVTAAGKPVPTQCIPLATWAKDGRFVRWLLVDFQVDAAASPSTPYALHFGADAPKAADMEDIRLTRDGDRLLVDTGAAEFTLRDRGGFQIESVKVGNTTLVSRDRPMRFLVTDQTGATYEATGDANPDGALIEDRGPCRVGLKSEGWYAAPDGKRFCRHAIRLEFFAGQTLVRVLHTFIFTGTSESNQVRDLALEIPAALGQDVIGTLGTSAGDPAAALTVPQPQPVYLTQDCLDRWQLQFKAVQTDSGKELATGERAGGWGRLAGTEGAVTAALRDPWQNYPYEMEIRGSKSKIQNPKSEILIHFWPLHGRLMDLRTPALLAPYGTNSLPLIDRFFLSQRPPYSRSIHDVYNNAMGMAKTHELWLDFSTEPTDQRTAALVTQAQQPVLASADPAWNCASGALGPLHPFDPDGFPEAEAALDAMFDRFVNWQRHFMDYGWFDYGDIHNDARGWDYGMKFAGGQAATLWRYWDSTHYGFPNSPWLLWLRSGKRKYLEFAEANARHCQDIDRCHYGDDKDRFQGGHYYCDWSIIPWNGRTETHINYDKLEYMLYSYYMRGYRRGLDVMKDWAELQLRFYKTGKGRDPFQMMLPAETRLYDIRHYGPPLGNMTELYRATWDERYLHAAQDWAAALVAMVPKEPEGWKDLGAVHYCWEGMENYVRLTGDSALREALTRYARAGIDFHFGYTTFADAAAGYAWTGDPLFLTAGRARLTDLLSRINTSDDPRARGAAGLWTAGCYPFAMRSLPVFLAALSSAPADWKTRNLPLTAANRSLHMAGPRLPVLYVKGTGTAPPTLRLRLGQQQELRVNDAGGQTLESLPASVPPRIDTLTFPAEPHATCTVDFAPRPTRGANDYIDRGNVDVVDVENAQLVLGPSTEDGKFCLFGLRFYFMVPRGTEEFSVTVDTHTTWAAYGWFPEVSVFAPDGATAGHQKGPGLLRFVLRPSPQQTGALWSVGPLGRVEAPSANATWLKPMRAPDEHFPAYFNLSTNLPPFVATHPDLFFVPGPVAPHQTRK